MKKWMVGAAVIIVLFLSLAGLLVKVKWDIASALDSRYAVLFLDDANSVDFAVAGDVHMFDDVVGNSLDVSMEKDGVSIRDAVTRFGDEEGEERVRAILAENGIHVSGIVFASDVLIASVYPEESIKIEGVVSPLAFRKDEVISLYRGEMDRMRTPLHSPYGSFFTAQTDITKDDIERFPLEFQIVLRDPATQQSYNILVSGDDLETLCVEGVLTKTFYIRYSVTDIEGNVTQIAVAIPATVTLEDVSRYPTNDTLTVNRSLRYGIDVDASAMIDILRESEEAPVDVSGNHKVKAWILDMFPAREVDRELVSEMARQYRAGAIRIYPQPFTLRLLKVVPDSLLEGLIGFFWPSPQA